MSLSLVVEGERKLVGLLGANVGLGGIRAVIEKTHARLVDLMPFFSDMLVLVQVAVGIATLVYMIIKICKIVQNKKEP